MLPWHTPSTPLEQSQAPSPVAKVLDRMGLTPDLPRRLAQDAQERPFTPMQLTLSKDLVPQLSLLLRREPVGGAEPQIMENRTQIETAALHQVHRFLAGGTASLHAVVQDMLHATRTRKSTLEQHQTQVEQDYARVQDLLHPWQERVGKRAGKTGSSIWRWLIGGAGQLSLPEAGTLWNRREELALRRATGTAALGIYDRVLETLTDLHHQLDALLAQARRTRRTLRQQAEDARQTSGVFAPWTIHLAPHVISHALLERVDTEGLVLDLLERLSTAPESDMLESHVLDLARQVAIRHLEEHSLLEQIVLDAHAGDTVPTDDPVLVVGQALLQAVQHPTWRLVRGARPRIATIQVTPDGTPVYDLEGLHSAAYGGGAHRLGFVQVQLGVARDELALLQDSDGTFEATLQQRNFYVLDDLAALSSTTPTNEGLDWLASAVPHHNGHALRIAREDEEGAEP